MNGFSMIPKPDHRASQRAVDTFNNATAIGTPVLVSFEGGKERPGKVSSRAFIHGARGPVVRVAFVGIDGLFPTTRLRGNPVPENSENSVNSVQKNP